MSTAGAPGDGADVCASPTSTRRYLFHVKVRYADGTRSEYLRIAPHACEPVIEALEANGGAAFSSVVCLARLL